MRFSSGKAAAAIPGGNFTILVLGLLRARARFPSANLLLINDLRNRRGIILFRGRFELSYAMGEGDREAYFIHFSTFSISIDGSMMLLQMVANLNSIH